MGDKATYSPGPAAMDRESLEGAAKAAQSLTDRRFQDFEGDIEIIIGMDRGRGPCPEGEGAEDGDRGCYHQVQGNPIKTGSLLCNEARKK